MMYNDALWWLEVFFKCSRLQQLQDTPNEAWGGIYIAQPLKLAVGGKLTEKARNAG